MILARYCSFILLLLFSFSINAQNNDKIPSPTTGKERLKSAQSKIKSVNESLLKGLKVKNIGPTVQSGRVVDIAVNPDSSHIFYVAYASGGLWKTINNGASFTPLFDHEMTMTIGSVEVNWRTNEIWLGTGEVNSSRSSYAGLGVFYSNNDGVSWEHKGLEDTHHIGRIIIDPEDNKTVYVAALGHLYSPNNQRGVFKTTDGGKNWEKVLFISENTGVVELILDPKNPNILYASSWERDRKAWNFIESGSESAIYHSTDKGNTWKKMTTDSSGFPTGDGVGRIGLDMGYKNNQPVLYALLDNYNRREKEDDPEKGLTKSDFKSMNVQDLLNVSDELLQDYLRDNGFPKKYTVETVKADIKSNKYKPIDLASYIEDANRLLFDTPVIGAELYRSDNGGKTWQKTHDEFLDRVYNNYGYYFGLIKCNPKNPNEVYIGGVPLLKSTDGGKSFSNQNKDNVHADHHALWVNPKNPSHIINGNDGGINISYDGGEHWFKCNSPEVGQFYAIQVDYKEPYNVYGGLQDNGVWFGPHTYQKSTAWHQNGQYPYEMIMGGDGMQIQVDNTNNNLVYTGFQFGNYFRINLKTEERQYITPKHELGENPYRWNWQAPILLSSHNQDILYMGSNKLLRSMNQGDDFKAISNDLTAGGKKGDVAYGTITTISESPFTFGLIYTGSDDGMVYRTENGGASWSSINNGLPKNYWVSRIAASKHDINTVYLALNGYRWDNFDALIYKSTDRGNNWEQIGNDLPLEPVNVIYEDPKYDHILYVGTDNGLYVSTDSGISFFASSEDLPKVAIHDLVIQTDANDLVIGTHGRSIYTMDLTPLYHVIDSDDELAMESEINRKASNSWGKKNWLRKYNEPTQEIFIYSDESGIAQIQLETSEGETLNKTEMDLQKGFNYYSFDFTIDSSNEKNLRKFLNKNEKLEASENGKIYLHKGEYNLIVKSNKMETTTKISIE